MRQEVEENIHFVAGIEAFSQRNHVVNCLHHTLWESGMQPHPLLMWIIKIDQEWKIYILQTRCTEALIRTKYLLNFTKNAVFINTILTNYANILSWPGLQGFDENMNIKYLLLSRNVAREWKIALYLNDRWCFSETYPRSSYQIFSRVSTLTTSSSSRAMMYLTNNK